ncbi:MAG: SLC13/DASS family transporter [Comamonadaceae bacterium]|nr:MAG: SLC13/DASS family transporter [Comamonadaceae bacterium]
MASPASPGEEPESVHPRRVVACVAGATLAWWLAPGSGALAAGLGLFVLAALLWLTQALPLAVTALLVPLIAMASGLQEPRAALAPFASPIVFLFLGGFALAAALRRHGLARALAAAVLHLARGRRGWAVVMLAAVTAFAAMWMSNTATAALMLPLAMALLDAQDEAPGPAEQAFALLALTYSTALGGMTSLVGTPPTAMGAAQAGISFAGWFIAVAPLALLLWVGMLLLLYFTLRPRLGGQVRVERIALPWTRERVATAVVFALTVAGWMFGAPLAAAVGMVGDSNALVALAAVAALVLTGALRWREIEHEVPWGVLLLFGGGLALGEVMLASGASAFLVERLLALLGNAPPLLVLLGVVAFIVALSELMSNTASAALALPLFMPLAPSLGLAPEAMAMAIALAASTGFMLPVATPPNAMVFGTGRVSQAVMVRAGWKLDLLCIAGITAAAYWIWR